MGWALIQFDDGDGRYTIELDSGSEAKTAILAHLATSIILVDARIVELQAKIDEAAIDEENRRLAVEASVADYIAAIQAGQAPSAEQFTHARRYYAGMQSLIDPLKMRMAALKAAKSEALRLVTYWTEYEPLQSKQAWCVDFTEGASGYVATCDIPGESDLTLIAPGARGWQASDGVMTARRVLSPAAAYWNACALPGWQKFMPTHRWGTLTSIDYLENTANVTLGSATSSAQRLAVNQTSTLTDVPIEYMECSAAVFEVDDRVVVEFTGQDWTTPKIIGFLDNPRPCDWPLIWLTPSGSSHYYFGSRNPAVFGQIFDGGITVDARMNRGAWQTLSLTASAADFRQYEGPEYQTTPAPESAGHVPSSDPPNTGRAIIIMDRSTSGVGTFAFLRPYLSCLFSPRISTWHTEDEAGERDTWEFRIMRSGDVVFNAAMMDAGAETHSITNGALFTADPWFGTGSAKCLGGISLLGGSLPVSALDYDLFIEVGN